MISTPRTMLTCHWSARRLHRYLDADPAARLSPREVRRLEAHLAVCVRCRAAAEEQRLLKGVLTGWSSRRWPDPAAIARARGALDRILQGEDR